MTFSLSVQQQVSSHSLPCELSTGCNRGKKEESLTPGLVYTNFNKTKSCCEVTLNLPSMLCVSMRMDPIVSYLLLLALRWSTQSSVSWTERLSSCSYSSMQRRLNRMLNNSHDHKVLSLIDVKGFDPKEVTVTVKDRKVKVLAEHEEEHTTATGTEYNYRNITKEISLPLGVSEDEVTYSLGPNSVVKIEMARKSHPCPQPSLSLSTGTSRISGMGVTPRQPCKGDCICCPGLCTQAHTAAGSSISFHCRKARNKTIYLMPGLASRLGKLSLQRAPPGSGFLSLRGWGEECCHRFSWCTLPRQVFLEGSLTL
uniref:Outer dense fiber protein 1 n=1 Tax=Accipiter nisus TaxID=211598 RepID=A0A8B9M4Q8_9AVES